MTNDSEYQYLDESSFNEEVLNIHTPVIVEFGSDWCGGSRIMDPIVNDLAATHGNRIRLIRVDIERNKHLAAKYGIRINPTFLFMKKGEIYDSILGSAPREVFEAKLMKLLSGE